jgi:beta-N-acetylhexosaminidase
MNRLFVLGLLCMAFSACASMEPSREPLSIEAPERRPASTRSAEKLPSPEAAPSAAAPADPIEEILAVIGHMTLREKIAQHFIVWIPRGADTEAIAALKAIQPGGYILYSWNYGSAGEVRVLTAKLDAVDDGIPATVDVHPFIAADQEGGRVAAFRFKEFPDQPSAFQLGLLWDEAIVEASAYFTALELAYLGCNMDLAPVADLYPMADATIIGDRSFGPYPNATARWVAAYVRGLKRGGIIPTLKHFPGHGATTVDSHSDLPVVKTSMEDLRSWALIPFAEGIRAGAPVVMTAHILYPAIDGTYPATLSPTILKGLLRREMGFEGIILTDGFEMGALTKGFSKGEALAAALEAGVNLILLYNRYDPVEMIDIVEKLVRDGKLPVETIDRNLVRILRVKKDYGLLGGK